MKNYKRLTERDEFGNADIIGLNGRDLAVGLNFDDFNRLTTALNRLAELEDKIESGELMEREAVRKETAKEIFEYLFSLLVNANFANDCDNKQRRCRSLQKYGHRLPFEQGEG